jgi:hypothetical protein
LIRYRPTEYLAGTHADGTNLLLGRYALLMLLENEVKRILGTRAVGRVF